LLLFFKKEVLSEESSFLKKRSKKLLSALRGWFSASATREETNMLTRRTLALAGLAGAMTTARARAEAPPITIGFVQSGDFAPAIMAQEKGLFAKAGLDTKTLMIPIISDIPAGLVSGSMQIGASTGPALMQAVDNGLDLVLVSGNSRWSPTVATTSLLVAKDGGITKPEDLRGKRVGVPSLNSVLELLFRRWLLLHGVKPQDLTYVELAFPQMGDLVRTHQLDAAVVKEPFVGRALAGGAVVRLADFIKEVDSNGLNIIWLATREWADANRSAIAQFRAGLQSGIDFFLHDPEAPAIELRVLKSTTTVIPVFDTHVSTADLQFQEDLARQFGLIQGTPDVAKLIVS
jgi:NitT/TauT family transport system substrate-binding protein